jgi:chromosome segregation ATPase
MSEGDAPPETLEQRVETLEAALAESEEKLMKAAVFGRSLLGKTQELEATVAQLREENKMLGQKSAAERRELSTANERLNHQLRDAMSSNELLGRDLKAKEEELARATQSLRGGANTQEELTALKQAHDARGAELAKSRESERLATQSAAQASRAWESERQGLLEQLKQLRAVSDAAGSQATASQQVKSTLGEVARELEAVKAQNAELLAEKHSMEEAVTSLVRQTQELRVENEEQMAFLAQARDTIHALKKDRESSAASGNDNNASEAAAKGNSLLDELEANMDSKIKAQEARPARPTRPEGGGGDGAPENCEEYFLIAQTAVKIGLAMKFPHRSDEVFRVRGIDLYYKCLNSHVPFHQWHLWISRTLHAMLVRLLCYVRSFISNLFCFRRVRALFSAFFSYIFYSERICDAFVSSLTSVHRAT